MRLLSIFCCGKVSPVFPFLSVIFLYLGNMTSYTQQPINTEWTHRVGYPGEGGGYPGGRVSRGYNIQGIGIWGRVSDTLHPHPAELQKRAVYILLECFLFGLVDDILRFASSTFLSMFLPSH